MEKIGLLTDENEEKAAKISNLNGEIEILQYSRVKLEKRIEGLLAGNKDPRSLADDTHASLARPSLPALTARQTRDSGGVAMSHIQGELERDLLEPSPAHRLQRNHPSNPGNPTGHRPNQSLSHSNSAPLLPSISNPNHPSHPIASSPIPHLRHSPISHSSLVGSEDNLNNVSKLDLNNSSDNNPDNPDNLGNTQTLVRELQEKVTILTEGIDKHQDEISR